MINDSPRKRLPRAVSAVIVVAVAVALLAPGPWRQIEALSTGVLTPLQMGVSGTLGEVSGVVETVQKVRDLSDQNRAYKDQVDELQSQVIKMRELEEENRQLRDLLSMAQRTSPGELIPVAVIARDDVPYVQAITINRGSNGGVHEGSIVITHKGLVGRVERADPTSAKVRLITDINQSVAVRLQTESRSTGVLRGQSQGNLLVIEYLPQADTIRVGDPVITSGLGEVFPESLVVGKVARVEHKDQDPFQLAVVEPAVDMDKLEGLYVLADHPGS